MSKKPKDLKIIYIYSLKLTEDAFEPHLPLPALLAASSNSIKRVSSGVCLTFSRRTVTKPSDTKASVIFWAVAKSKIQILTFIETIF